MKVLFLQRRSLWVEMIGITYLAAALRRAGHEVILQFVNDPTDVAQAARFANADVAAFSAMTGGHRWAVAAAAIVKRTVPHTTTVLGGPHATYFPDVVRGTGVDYAVIGEGEQVLVQLLEALTSGDCSNVSNLAWMEDGTLRTTPLAPLVTDLDMLGMADRDLYPQYDSYFKWYPVKSVMGTRGCPNACSYCYNHRFRTLYKDLGPVIRKHSIPHIIEEIQHIRNRHGLRVVRFEDSNLNLDRDWMLQLLESYKREINLPFVCNVSIHLVDRESAHSLANAGCTIASFGLETGSESLRRELGKTVSNEAMRQGAAYLKEAGIQLNTTNMIGLPGETLEDAFSTITLNRDLGVDYPWALIFQPYPGLDITNNAIAAGHLDADDVESIGTSFDHSVLHMPDIDALVRLHRLFYLLWKMPRLESLARKLVRSRVPMPLLNGIHGIFYAWNVLRKNPLTLREFARVAWRHRSFQRNPGMQECPPD